MSRSPHRAVRGQDDASGGGSAGTGMEGRRRRLPARSGVRGKLPSRPTADPGRAEQTRPRASRSFVQWRAPPGRPEPRPLHGVWVDGVRDGSWGGWWAGGVNMETVGAAQYAVLYFCRW